MQLIKPKLSCFLSEIKSILLINVHIHYATLTLNKYVEKFAQNNTKKANIVDR